MNKNKKILRLFKPLEGMKNIDKLEKKTFEYLALPENCDGRGTTQATITSCTRTLRHFKSAYTKGLHHSDGEVRRCSQTLINSVRSEPFETIQANARAFNTIHKKAGRRRNVAAARNQARKVLLTNGCVLRELPTSEDLLSAGKSLDLCVARKDEFGIGYHNNLKDCLSEFFILEYARGKPRALIEIDIITREVSEFSFKANKKGYLNLSEAREILLALNANGDRCRAFANIGAFRMFLERRPKRMAIPTDLGDVQIWKDKKHIAIAIKSAAKKRRSWSLFAFDRKGTELSAVTWDDDSLSDEGLLALLFRHPELITNISQRPCTKLALF